MIEYFIARAALGAAPLNSVDTADTKDEFALPDD
jgi:hypothetical protein